MPDPCCTVPKNTSHPDDACAELIEKLHVIDTEVVTLADAAGRILAEQIIADRDSPACDVSAMDGYGVRIADVHSGPIPIAGEVLMGQQPTELKPGTAIKVFTGGAVTKGVECIVRREFVDESNVERDGVVSIPSDASDLFPGAHIRRRGENTRAGEVVRNSGVVISPAHISSMAAFGYDKIRVFKKVRVTLLVTGNELCDVDSSPTEFAIRDSNGPALRALLAQFQWIDIVRLERVSDERSVLLKEAQAALGVSDTVVFTGGVSMGDHDYVPSVLQELGSETVFHKLAIRPGKPLLGCVGPDGQAVLGLPGNPASALTTMLRLGMGILAKRAGLTENPVKPKRMRIVNADEKTLPLWWFRPVRMLSDRSVEFIHTKGSGDLASLANSDGFVQQEQGCIIEETVDFWSWIQ